jgi:predicted DNA-binding protein YlxM (UPF0122 family)
MSKGLANIRERDSLLDNGLEMVDAYKRVILAIKNGTPELKACHAEGISITSLRRFIQDTNKLPSDVNPFWYRHKYTWQDKMFNAIFPQYNVAPDDFDERFKLAIATLCERQATALMYRYKDGMTFEEVGDKFGISRQRAAQLCNRAVANLRNPKCQHLFLLNDEVLAEIKESRKQTIESYISELKDSDLADVIETEISLRTIAIEDLGVSSRLYNCLLRSGLKNVYQICEYGKYNNWCQVRNLGAKSFYELRRVLKKVGVDLPSSDIDKNIFGVD